MLPKVNGFEILKEIREEKIDTKVIMLTAKVELEDKLHGFNYGANDYVTKPFHIEELLARVNAQLNTANNINSDYLEVGNTRLNTKTSTIENIDTNETIDIIGKERHYTHTQQVCHVADILIFLAFALQFSNERLLCFDAVLQRIEFYAHMLQGV